MGGAEAEGECESVMCVVGDSPSSSTSVLTVLSALAEQSVCEHQVS